MKKFFCDKNIIIILIALNVIYFADCLIDYKTDRLIDANVENSQINYIYKR